MIEHKIEDHIKHIRYNFPTSQVGVFVDTDLCDRNASDGYLQGDDWINGSSKGELDWPSHLSTVHFCRHHSTKRANVIEILAHPASSLNNFICLLFSIIYLDI